MPACPAVAATKRPLPVLLASRCPPPTASPQTEAPHPPSQRGHIRSRGDPRQCRTAGGFSTPCWWHARQDAGARVSFVLLRLSKHAQQRHQPVQILILHLRQFSCSKKNSIFTLVGLFRRCGQPFDTNAVELRELC